MVEDIRGVRPTSEPLQNTVPATVSTDSLRVRKSSDSKGDGERLGTSGGDLIAKPL